MISKFPLTNENRNSPRPFMAGIVKDKRPSEGQHACGCNVSISHSRHNYKNILKYLKYAGEISGTDEIFTFFHPPKNDAINNVKARSE